MLGALVAPTDAVAASAIAERLGIPHRLAAIIEGESLVNDATALVAYRFAVAAVLTGTFSLSHATWRFVVEMSRAGTKFASYRWEQRITRSGPASGN